MLKNPKIISSLKDLHFPYISDGIYGVRKFCRKRMNRRKGLKRSSLLLKTIPSNWQTHQIRPNKQSDMPIFAKDNQNLISMLLE